MREGLNICMKLDKLKPLEFSNLQIFRIKIDWTQNILIDWPCSVVNHVIFWSILNVCLDSVAAGMKTRTRKKGYQFTPKSFWFLGDMMEHCWWQNAGYLRLEFSQSKPVYYESSIWGCVANKIFIVVLLDEECLYIT